MKFRNLSAAAFGQLEWAITDRLSLLPGLRVNYDQKSVNFDQRVYGGLQTDDPRLIALQRSVLAPQAYNVDVDDTNLSGQVTLAYGLARAVNTYATYSTNFKSVGLNLNGVPTDALGRPVLETATVKPEEVRHFEVGCQDRAVPRRHCQRHRVQYRRSTIPDPGRQRPGRGAARLPCQRGEGARARRRVRRQRQGEPSDSSSTGRSRIQTASTCPSPTRRRRSRRRAARWSRTSRVRCSPASRSGRSPSGASMSIRRPSSARAGEVFGAVDTSYRSEFSSSPSASQYMVVGGYGLVNARVGFRWAQGWDVFVWSRNLFDREYYEFLTAAPGNSGLDRRASGRSTDVRRDAPAVNRPTAVNGDEGGCHE